MASESEPTIKDLASMLIKQEQNINKRLDEMTSKIDNINNHFSEKFTALESKLKGMEKSTAFISEQYESHRKMVDNMLKKQVALENENAEFKKEIKDMERKLFVASQEMNDLQQYGRRECVEIAGVPKIEQENTEELALKVFSEIGVKVNPSDIVACHRLPSRRGDPIIITKLLNRKTAGEILANRKKLRNVTASDLGFEAKTNGKIFINESLTKQNKELYRSVREKAKAKEWKFTWTWNGHIYARKDESTAPARFSSPRDVEEKLI